MEHTIRPLQEQRKGKQDDFQENRNRGFGRKGKSTRTETPVQFGKKRVEWCSQLDPSSLQSREPMGRGGAKKKRP